MSDSTDLPATPSGTRRLVLVRHAKAVSDGRDNDRARSLTGRGRRDASSVGAWLGGRLDHIDTVWSSSAARAKETFEVMATHLDDAPKPDLRDDMYDAGPDDLLEMVREADDATRVLMVVGHNPTIERLQAWLTDDDRGFPTCATAIVEFDGTWADLDPGDARLVDFRVP